ncbi:signal peptide peptidase sppA [Neokomagataea thailandica NBRC 106555]|uniref:Signal peptide peptidase SppA n=2 Tax=Neokomagataea TaxID=1223423 RepID=A0A4Y6V1Z3_9PROT|nr:MULTISPECIES: signal peptide peptidase SppA [Neokomagataea]QDH24023.1 signal peptide peptidase SppA [Neokomagataea tanensis]GBR52317.1 signal peptide peptidase sppA [Neokomagataea thailandica NBRC 106555]
MNNDAEKRIMLALQRRRLLRWRIGAVLSFIFAFGVLVLPTSIKHKSTISTPHIARITIDGIIGDNVSLQERAIYHAAKDESVTGLLVIVNSPGGAVTGGERLHNAIERFASKKPVAVSMGGLGASAAYMLSAPAQHIVAMPSTLTGSIGVILERYDFSPLLGRLGVSNGSIISGDMKNQTDPSVALSPGGRDMLQGIVHDLFDQFVTMVAQGRHMTVEKVKSLADGRPYTGRQALALGLVDELGTEKNARDWLKHRLNITSATYPVCDIAKKENARKFFGIPYKAVIGTFLGESAARRFEMASTIDTLDGPVAILSW